MELTRRFAVLDPSTDMVWMGGPRWSRDPSDGLQMAWNEAAAVIDTNFALSGCAILEVT